MQLKEFSLISTVVESGSVLKALETAIPSVAIERAISETKSSEQRQRALPTHLVVCLTRLCCKNYLRTENSEDAEVVYTTTPKIWLMNLTRF